MHACKTASESSRANRFEHRAVRHIGAGTFRSGFGKNSFNTPEIRDPRANVGKVPFRSLFDLCAGWSTAVLKAQKSPDIVHREPEFAGPQDEAQACGMGRGVDAVTCVRSGRVGQEADFLVVADRLDVAAGRAGQVSSREATLALVI